MRGSEPLKKKIAEIKELAGEAKMLEEILRDLGVDEKKIEKLKKAIKNKIEVLLDDL